MSRRKLLHAFLLVVVTLCLLILPGTLSAQGNSAEAFARVKEVQERHTDGLMSYEGVAGTAIGLDETGEDAILVLLERPGVPGIPADLEGVPVRPVVTGAFYALAKPQGKPGKPPRDTTPPAAPQGLAATVISSSQINLDWADNTEPDWSYYNVYRGVAAGGPYSRIASNVKSSAHSSTGLTPDTTYYYVVTAVDTSGNQSLNSNEALATTPAGTTEPSIGPRPAPIGVSTGHPNITAGTIGCRVIDGAGNVYALSNNHVYADENRAFLGDSALQPGPYDKGQDPRDKIGTLADFEPIVFSRFASNQIDAAIALSSTTILLNTTPAGTYSYKPSHTTAPAAVNLAVKKHGRTTGLTHGQVYATNASVNVRYDSGTARFVNQIIITPGTFSSGGDSGSLIVTESGNYPVGLLFAGSSSYTIANPIGPVLIRFGVTVDDR